MEQQEQLPPPAILSMEEIKAGLSELARSGEGAQRTQAYRLLMNMESATVTLPPPLSRQERLERYARLTKALGIEDAQIGFQMAFPTSKRKIDDRPKYTLDDVPARVRGMATQVTTLKKLKKLVLSGGDREAWPKGGFPKGYPVYEGKVAQARWCVEEAAKYYLLKLKDTAAPVKEDDPEQANP